jgi:triosephosphate isomerase
MKMFKTQAEVKALAEGLVKTLGTVSERDVCLCPPFTGLSVMREAFKGSSIALGGQDMYWEKEGAFTGEVSAEMLIDAGCAYVIIGHSERRQYFAETDVTVNRKIQAAFRAGLRPIVCVGELLAQREAGATFAVLETQINGGLKGLPVAAPDKMVIAYEPVWAIGTGKTATPEQAQEVHAFIRKNISALFGKTIADGMRILYGGSVKPDNIKGLMKQQDIDGALVGGACLKADQFSAIINY